MSQNKLYTESLNGDVKTQVRRIDSANNTNRFISQPYMMSSGEGEQSANGYCEWVEAKRSKDGTWLLKKHTQFMSEESANKEDAVCQTKTIISGICFFDALHYCATEQSYRVAQGALAVDMKTLGLNKKMFKLIDVVAKESNQPLDLNDVPIPAMYGEIMVDGAYSVAARKLAEKTEDAPLLPEVSNTNYLRKQVDLLPDVIGNSVMSNDVVPISNRAIQIQNTIGVDQTLALNAKTSLRAKQLVAGSYYQMKGQGRTLVDAACQYLPTDEYITKRESPDLWGDNVFAPGFGSLILAIPLIIPSFLLGTPLISIFGGAALFTAAKLDSFYFRDVQRMKRSVKKLPEGDYKNMMRDFTKAVEANTYLGRAAHIINSGGSLSKRKTKKGLKCIDRACEVMNFSEIEKGNLVKAFLSQNFPEREYFENKIEELYNSLVDERDAVATQLLEATGANPDKATVLIKKWVPKF